MIQGPLFPDIDMSSNNELSPPMEDTLNQDTSDTVNIQVTPTNSGADCTPANPTQPHSRQVRERTHNYYNNEAYDFDEAFLLHTRGNPTSSNEKVKNMFLRWGDDKWDNLIGVLGELTEGNFLLCCPASASNSMVRPHWIAASVNLQILRYRLLNSEGNSQSTVLYDASVPDIHALYTMREQYSQVM